jgi:pilus assembly protein CpaE
MRAGADEFLEFPVDATELSKALEGLAKRKGVISTRQGKVVAMFSAAGGVGCTTIACNLGANIALEMDGQNACALVDMNIQFGTVALAMNISEFSHTLADAVRDSDRLDQNLLQGMMVEHDSGCSVLPAPLNVTELESFDPMQVDTVIDTCRKAYRYVVLDMPHKIDEISITGLEAADEIFLVTDMVVPSIRNTIRVLETLRELEYKEEKIKLIISKYYDSHQISLDEIGTHVGVPIYWLVPYDSPAAIAAMNSGDTIDAVDPDSQAGHSLVALAQTTAGIVPKARSKRKRVFWSWSR